MWLPGLEGASNESGTSTVSPGLDPVRERRPDSRAVVPLEPVGEADLGNAVAGGPGTFAEVRHEDVDLPELARHRLRRSAELDARPVVALGKGRVGPVGVDLLT